MNELQVVVNQTPGTVTWNYEDLKKAIANALKAFKETEYDDSNIAQAKKDRAMLNKLSKQVNDRKKEIKEKCLEPFKPIDEEAKDLVAIIQEPIKVIDERLDEYEKARREKAKATIMEYMEEAFEEIDQEIAQKAKGELYNTKWENATAKKSEWQTAIDKRVEILRSDLAILDGIEEEFRTNAMEVYKRNLSLSAAMQKVNELRTQKAQILERQKEEEERKRREEEEKRRHQAEQPQSDIGKTIESIEREAFAHVISSGTMSKPVMKPSPLFPQMNTAPKVVVVPPMPSPTPNQIIRITGSAEEYQKVIEYIEAMGIGYEEV